MERIVHKNLVAARPMEAFCGSGAFFYFYFWLR